MLPYRTADGRVITLQLLSPDRYWPDLCKLVGHPDVAADPRFADLQSRAANAGACVEWLDGVFAEKTLEAWRRALADDCRGLRQARQCRRSRRVCVSCAD